ncbi:uncharacterized protein Fot_33719 [Forsythia ovata]|uniref:Uncharacterized protein n=1 Tax=Forsythia ovata TaxID=205694 RepID=A0ABD1TBF7_9LAMI
MSASQLLRILQTFPSDLKYETCVFDTARSKVVMKENQNGTLCHSNSFGKVADPVFFTTRETFQLNTCRKDTGSMDIEAKAIDELWNGKLVENFSEDDENRSGGSPTMEDKKRFSNNDCEGTTDPLASDMKGRENLPNSPELESSLKDENFFHGNENESKNTAVSDLFGTDKNITESELPELVISCKEVNYHIVKDICVDDGIPIEETILIESNKDDSSGVNVCLPPRRCETTEGDLDSELQLTGSCLEYSKDDIASNEYGTEGGGDGKSLVPVGPKSASEISFDKDTTRECDPKDSIQACLVMGGATGKVESDLSEGSFVNNMLPMQEFGTRSFLRSFLNSLNSEEKEVAHPLDQISSGGANKKFQPSSEMGSGSNTFNFNSPKPAAACSMNESIESVNEQSVKSEDVHDHKDANFDNLSDTSSVQCASTEDKSIGNVREQCVKDESHDNSSSTCSRGCTSIENVKQSPDHEGRRSDDQSLGQVLFASRKDNNTGNARDQALEMLKTSKHVDGNLKAQCDYGESSFSAGDHVTYSGPIPFSGSLSLRSDSSAATSTRSFAFPVVQSDWNISPVRMAKADRRHFRKHKGWRSGLLCCRF